MIDRFRLERKPVKEKGISKIIRAAVIIIIVVVAGVGAYFLMKPF